MDFVCRGHPRAAGECTPEMRTCGCTHVELFTCFLNRWKCRFELILLSEFVPSFFEERGALCTEHSLFLSFIFCASFSSSEDRLNWEDECGVQLTWLKYVHIQ